MRSLKPISTAREGTYSHLYRTKRWSKLRAAHLALQPLCVMCQQYGEVEDATIVDHITPHRGNMDLFWSGPFQSLCETCHNRHKKMQESGGRLMGCDAMGIPIDTNHLWNQDGGVAPA
jgi:5-methylcytosine-specific restriction endonuclease McrA